MNYKNPFGCEIRKVSDTVHDGQPARVVCGTRTYATDIDDLWDALTNSERIPRWFSPICGDLSLGGRYQLQDNANGIITRCDSPEALDITWEYGGNISWVKLRLTTKGEHTLLSLEHIMTKDEASEAHWKQYGPGATGVGWDLSFLGLGLHLNSNGGQIDQEATNNWLMSAPGKTFIKFCAHSWGEAHITCGESVEIATNMAQQTAAFYSGE